MVRLNFPFRRNAALLLLAAALLAGCAGQRLQREGLTLLDEGRIEEGLAKLTEASNAEPDNLSYRTDAGAPPRPDRQSPAVPAPTASAPPVGWMWRRQPMNAFSGSIQSTAAPGWS